MDDDREELAVIAEVSSADGAGIAPVDISEPQGDSQTVAATDLRGRLRAQGFAWDYCEVIATVVDEWLTDSSGDTVDTVADIDNWQRA